MFNRLTAKRKLATWLLGRFFVRFHLLLIVAFSFFAGLAVSRGAMMIGADSPLLRYPLVVLTSYIAFLIAVRLWLWYAGFQYRESDVEWDAGNIDVPHSGSGSSGTHGGTGPDIHPGGGEFGGGGADGDWAAGTDLNGLQAYEAPAFDPPSLDAVDLGDIGGADEGCGVLVLLLVALAALLAVFGVGVHLLANGPVLLAEAALEAAMAAGLFGRLHRIEDPGWVGGAVAASWQYFIVVMSVAVVLALTIHNLAPGSRTIVEAFHRLF